MVPTIPEGPKTALKASSPRLATRQFGRDCYCFELRRVMFPVGHTAEWFGALCRWFSPFSARPGAWRQQLLCSALEQFVEVSISSDIKNKNSSTDVVKTSHAAHEEISSCPAPALPQTRSDLYGGTLYIVGKGVPSMGSKSGVPCAPTTYLHYTKQVPCHGSNPPRWRGCRTDRAGR